jgi:hypothetical protein
MDISGVKDHLADLLHGATLNALDSTERVLRRAQNVMNTKIDLVSTMRTVGLVNPIHDDVYNYALPSDYRKIIDLYPQDDRGPEDYASRKFAEPFDLEAMFEANQLSVESSEGTKVLRVNWRTRAPKTLHTMDSLTSNGAWAVVGTASGLQANSIFKKSGSASIEFDVAADGDGIQNNTMTAVDMTSEDEVADIFVPIFFGSVSALTSVSAIWGNDLTTNYWTSVAQTTQADGTAFKVGWNLIKFPWSTATEAGSVNPASIDSFKITIDRTAAIANIRVDNITFSIGRNFDLKYYSKYIFKNSAGTWLSAPSSDSDTIVLDEDELQIFFLECLVAASHQIGNKKTVPDIEWARLELKDLYAKYESEHPSQSKKATIRYYERPRRRGYKIR